VATGEGAVCAQLTPFGDFAPQTPLDGMAMYPSPGEFPWDVTEVSFTHEPLSWTFVLPAVLGLGDAKVAVYLETSSGPKPIDVTFGPAGGSLNEATLWISPKSNPARGSTVVVEITNIPVGPVGYRIHFADCGTVPPPPDPDASTASCFVLDQNCPPGLACHLGPSGDVFDGRCGPAGAYPPGKPCPSSDACVAGTDCLDTGSGTFVCSAFCDFGANAMHPCDATCPAGYKVVWGLVNPDDGGFLGGIGVCRY
jgi:hypothetical protein